MKTKKIVLPTAALLLTAQVYATAGDDLVKGKNTQNTIKEFDSKVVTTTPFDTNFFRLCGSVPCFN